MIAELFSWFKHALITTDTIALRSLIIGGLGLLMSLTPCVLPMIPITIGIIQAGRSQSLFQNFLNSLAYTLGIALTFAILGMLAAFGGVVFGRFMMHPLIITILAAILLYAGLGLSGFFELNMPRFLQQQIVSIPATGPRIYAAFIMGILGGTIASPCVSPGLALLLSLVAHLGSPALGFWYLFVFGFGLGIPFLIAGTSSELIHILPKTGVWMIEIKRVFGGILIITGLYFIHTIVPWYITLALGAFCAVAIGILFMFTRTHTHSNPVRIYQTIMGVACIALAVGIGTEAVKAYTHPTVEISEFWETDYDHARARAQSEKKYLFVDVTANWCSLCTSITKKLETEIVLRNALLDFVLLKVDGTDQDDPHFAQFAQQYKINKFPSFIIIDPESENIVAEWGSELYTSPEETAQIIAAYA